MNVCIYVCIDVLCVDVEVLSFLYEVVLDLSGMNNCKTSGISREILPELLLSHLLVVMMTN